MVQADWTDGFTGGTGQQELQGLAMYGEAPLALPFLLQNNTDLESKAFCPT